MVSQIKKYTIGVDVGGTKMSGILYDGENIVADDLLATPKDSYDHFVVMLQALIDPLIEKARTNKVKISGVGLGVAGAIDYKISKMLKSPNLPIIDGKFIAKDLSEKINLPVVMDNDAKCYVRAEALLGAGKGYSSVMGITLGTGIGNGWWVNNEVHHGAFGGAGEIGQMIIDFKENLKLEDAYHQLMHSNPEEKAVEAYRGDQLAEKSFEEFGKMLGVALANITNLVDPEIYILGGHVIDSSDLFLGLAKKIFKENIESSKSAKMAKVVKGKLGKNAGAIGAALLFADK
jgi:predicted NBD/HSP70 family sugar kinase